MRKIHVMKRVKPVIDFNIDIDWEKRLEWINADKDELTTFYALGAIVTLVEHSRLSDEFWKHAEPYISFICKQQGINKIQSVLLAIITEYCSDDQCVSTTDLAEELGCKNIDIMKHKTELMDLLRRGFIYYHRKFNPHGYITSPHAMDAFMGNETYHRPSMANAEGVILFKHFFNITHKMYEEEITHDLMFMEVEELFKQNPEHPYVKALKKYELSMQDQVVVTSFCRHLLFDGRANIDGPHYLYLYDDIIKFTNFTGETLAQKSPQLIQKELIEHSCNNGLKDIDEFCLTAKAREDLLKGFNIKSNDDNRHMFVIENNDIKQKSLFFNNATTIQYKELGDLLTESHYQDIRRRLAEKNMRCGFTCLFYGAPGTGKTEMALQLARLTGRDIMQVNIAEMKSMWVGESEKNVKQLFDRYRGLVMHSKITPILLFNEADAVISKRSTHVDRAVDKMENSLQNIILQEMENLDGIMIATTNLEQNLDAAFERRFLYKVRFEKPELPQRQAIWHSMLPHLESQFIEPLAAKYDFSGGQIENISRKLEIDSILYGSENSIHKLEQFCQDEVLNRRNTRPIGFVS